MKIIIFCAALLIFPVLAMAGVNPKNGNFSITYLDIASSSETHPLELQRTYNSKSSGVGWFGFGWGTSFETRLLVMPDNSVIVTENGLGREKYYAPADGSLLQAGVDKIVAAAIEREKLDPEAATALRKQLLSDEELRRKKVIKYGIQTQLPVGSTASANDCSVVTRLADEYRRTSGLEGDDYFDLSGRLVRKESDGYKLTIHYAGKYPDRIEDTLGQKLFLMWTAAGHIAAARSDMDGTAVQYSYDINNKLLMSKPLKGNYYQYEYDKNYNITKIEYIDHTHMDIQYDENSTVTSVTETDGSELTFSYRVDPNNPSSHYWTTTTKTSVTGEQSSREDEFSFSKDSAGVEKLLGLASTVGESKQGIVYDEHGRIKRVEKPGGGFSEYVYHPTLNKISELVTDKGNTVFGYDTAGNLIRAFTSQGQLIVLGYDSHKHIDRLVETNKDERRELTFRYNAAGKPIEINLLGKGTINVKYDKAGNIVKVDSKQGAKTALEVTRAFQVLLEVVKTGGVDLEM
jgi:YD repeat-containing protein